jgi:hypothetical protein
MNKKMIVISVSITITLMLLTIPLASAGVPRNISKDLTGTARMCDPTTEPEAGIFVPGITKYVGPKDSAVNPNPDNPENRRDQISSGAIFFGVINIDCLGVGTMKSESIHGVIDQETGEGFGVFKWTWVFDNPTCKGTIEGIYKGEQKIAFPTMIIQGTAILCKGTGDLQNVKIEVTNYQGVLPLMTFTTEGFSATIDGTIWGLND